MLKEDSESDGKTLRVMFARKDVIDVSLVKKLEHKRRLYKKMAEDLAKETMKKKIAVICAEFEKNRELKRKRIAKIIREVKEANRQEDLVTEKFLGDVESMVIRFKTELDRMQEMFGNIINQLPQVKSKCVLSAKEKKD